jgi:hypothetical protein
VACAVPVAEPMVDIPEAAPVSVCMLPDIDMSVAVEFLPDVLVNLLWLALPVALPLVPPAMVALGALLSIAAMVPVFVAPAPLLSVLFFTAFVFVAIVVVASCAATVQVMRAARSMDEYRILSSEGSICEMYG